MLMVNLARRVRFFLIGLPPRVGDGFFGRKANAGALTAALGEAVVGATAEALAIILSLVSRLFPFVVVDPGSPPVKSVVVIVLLSLSNLTMGDLGISWLGSGPSWAVAPWLLTGVAMVWAPPEVLLELLLDLLLEAIVELIEDAIVEV